MGIKCPKCKKSNTKAISPGKMICDNCSHSWKPYAHRGKKMKVVGDGIITTKRRVMPGSKTRVIGDGIITRKVRVKKVKRKKSLFGF